jgi:hypothetical protein
MGKYAGRPSHVLMHVEFIGEEANRQVSVIAGVWTHSRVDCGSPDPHLTDLMLSDTNLDGSEPITQEEFEATWAEALRRDGPTAPG